VGKLFNTGANNSGLAIDFAKLRRPPVEVVCAFGEPWILVVRGEPTDQLLLFGGEIIYVPSSRGQLVKQIHTFRKRRNDKFWRTGVVRLDDDSILIVYEVGALVIESSLDVRWHVEKGLIDFFHHREAAQLVFLRDHDVRFTIDIATGESLPAKVTGK
jgi:hypothetical protein